MSGQLHPSLNKGPEFMRRYDNEICECQKMIECKPFNHSEKFVKVKIGRVSLPRVNTINMGAQ